MKDFIEKLRAYSPQTRKMIAFAGSGVFTALVAFMWIVGIGASGTLAIHQEPKEKGGDFFKESNMASIVEAFRTGLSGEEAGVTVVEEISTSTLQDAPQTDSTVIPF